MEPWMYEDLQAFPAVDFSWPMSDQPFAGNLMVLIGWTIVGSLIALMAI